MCEGNHKIEYGKGEDKGHEETCRVLISEVYSVVVTILLTASVSKETTYLVGWLID